MRLNFAVQLKTFQRLGYFPEFKMYQKSLSNILKNVWDYLIAIWFLIMTMIKHGTSIEDHICSYLKINRWKKKSNSFNWRIQSSRQDTWLSQIAYQAAQTMNHPADIINVVIEELIHHHYELPRF